MDSQRLALGVAVVVGAPPVAGPLDLPPSSRWRPWIDERLAGSIGRPASAPSGTVDHGGRAVVVPTWLELLPGLPGHQPDRVSWHIRPWHGPIVTVV